MDHSGFLYVVADNLLFIGGAFVLAAIYLQHRRDRRVQRRARWTRN